MGRRYKKLISKEVRLFFEKIQTQILDAYTLLSDDNDRELFYDYLLANVKLYFDKFEDELQANLSEPESPDYEMVTTTVEEPVEEPVPVVPKSEPEPEPVDSLEKALFAWGGAITKGRYDDNPARHTKLDDTYVVPLSSKEASSSGWTENGHCVRGLGRYFSNPDMPNELSRRASPLL